MDTPTRTPERCLNRAGGLSAVVIFAGYVLTIPIYVGVGEIPSDTAAQLAYFGAHANAWWTILGLMVFTDLLYIPVWLALYQTLSRINRPAMQTAVAFKALFVVLDLAVTWIVFGTLIRLGALSMSAGDPAAHAALSAAAAFPSTVLQIPIPSFYAILFPALGTLIAGIVLRRGTLGNTVSWLALVTGVTGILAAAVPVLGLTARWPHILNAFLATLWYLLVGIRLLSFDPAVATETPQTVGKPQFTK